MLPQAEGARQAGSGARGHPAKPVGPGHVVDGDAGTGLRCRGAGVSSLTAVIPCSRSNERGMSDRSRKLAWAAVMVAVATGLSRVAGLGREVLVAAVYGVDPEYNTLVSVSVIPNLIQQLFGRFTGTRHHLSKQHSHQYAISLGDMPLDADAARFLAADQNVIGQHQVADVIEAHRRLVECQAIRVGQTVEHLRG